IVQKILEAQGDNLQGFLKNLQTNQFSSIGVGTAPLRDGNCGHGIGDPNLNLEESLGKDVAVEANQRNKEEEHEAVSEPAKEAAAAVELEPDVESRLKSRIDQAAIEKLVVPR